VARFVLLEHARATDRRQTSFDEARLIGGAVAPARVGGADPTAEDALLLDHLDGCLQQLTAADRALILDYYAGDDRDRIARRRALAARLHLTPNAIAVRACRIRDRLEACVRSKASEV